MPLLRQLSFFHKILLILGGSLVIYGTLVAFEVICFSQRNSNLITILSFFISFIIFLRALFIRASSLLSKIVSFVSISIMVVLVVFFLYLRVTNKEENVDITILSNYSTIVAFGISFLAFIVDENKQKPKRILKYVLETENNVKVIKTVYDNT